MGDERLITNVIAKTCPFAYLVPDHTVPQAFARSCR